VTWKQKARHNLGEICVEEGVQTIWEEEEKKEAHLERA
jgi:hypothetical protein